MLLYYRKLSKTDFLNLKSGGWLSGKMVREKGAPEGSRVAINSQPGKNPTAARPNFKDLASDERTWNILDSCKNIAEKHNKSVAQVLQYDGLVMSFKNHLKF